MTWYQKARTIGTLLIGSWAGLQGANIAHENVFADNAVEEVAPNESTNSLPSIVGFSAEQEATIAEAFEQVHARVPRLAQLQTIIRHSAGAAPIKGNELAATFYNVNLPLERIISASPEELNNATLCGNFPERLAEKWDHFKESHAEEDLRDAAHYLLQSMIHLAHPNDNLDVIDIYDAALLAAERQQTNGFRTHVDASLRGIVVHELAHLLLDSDLPRANHLHLAFDRLNHEYRRQRGIRNLSSDDVCAEAWVSRYAANNYGIGMQNYRAASGAVPLIAQLLNATGSEEDKALARDLEETLPISRLGWIYGEEAAEGITEAILHTDYELGEVARRKVAAANAFLDETRDK